MEITNEKLHGDCCSRLSRFLFGNLYVFYSYRKKGDFYRVLAHHDSFCSCQRFFNQSYQKFCLNLSPVEKGGDDLFKFSLLCCYSDNKKQREISIESLYLSNVRVLDWFLQECKEISDRRGAEIEIDVNCESTFDLTGINAVFDRVIVWSDNQMDYLRLPIRIIVISVKDDFKHLEQMLSQPAHNMIEEIAISHLYPYKNPIDSFCLWLHYVIVQNHPIQFDYYTAEMFMQEIKLILDLTNLITECLHKQNQGQFSFIPSDLLNLSMKFVGKN
jgi:hypothetical protein